MNLAPPPSLYWLLLPLYLKKDRSDCESETVQSLRVHVAALPTVSLLVILHYAYFLWGADIWSGEVAMYYAPLLLVTSAASATTSTT